VRGDHIGTHQPIASPPSFLQGTTGDGIDVTGDDNDVGSPVAEDRNVVAASGLLANQASFGVRIAGDGNRVRGNTIGADPGVTTSQIGNRGGVQVASGSRNRVGGSAVGGGQTVDTGNVVGGNLFYGISLASADTTPGGGNLVWGNHVGTDESATRDLGNTGPGVLVVGGNANLIGGTGRDGGKANVIADNDGAGVSVTATRVRTPCRTRRR
jgi:hypothetical protein